MRREIVLVSLSALMAGWPAAASEATPAGATSATKAPSQVDTQAVLERALSLEHGKHFADAATAYRQILARGPNCLATRNLGRLVVSQGLGSIEEARSLADQAIAQGCAQPRDLITAAKLDELMGDPAAARAHYEAAYRMDPGDEEAAKRYGGYLERSGSVDAAVAIYEAYLRRRPDAATFHYFISGCRAHQGRCKEARHHFQAFLRYAGQIPDIARTTRGNPTFARCPKELEALISGVEKAQVLLAEARALASAGAPPPHALELLDRGVGVAPDYAVLLLEIGRVYEKMGDLKRALYVNEAFLRLAPYDPEAAEVRATDSRLRKKILAP